MGASQPFISSGSHRSKNKQKKTVPTSLADPATICGGHGRREFVECIHHRPRRRGHYVYDIFLSRPTFECASCSTRIAIEKLTRAAATSPR
jgi:hypothetical protein